MRHTHLMKVLSAFSHGWKYCLILPLAKGNLETLWRTITPSPWNLMFLIEQCYGIAQGLQRIHNHNAYASGFNRRDKVFMGRHGDIKPQNILWYSNSFSEDEEDRLVLSDFTLMRFHAEGSSNCTTLRDIGGTHTYRAPETDVSPMKHVSPQYDVWSLGCVFLEFISCYLLGYDATRGNHFSTVDGRNHLSFKVMRQMDDDNERTFLGDKYFNRSRKDYPDNRETLGAEVKTSVGQVSCSEPFMRTPPFGIL